MQLTLHQANKIIDAITQHLSQSNVNMFFQINIWSDADDIGMVIERNNKDIESKMELATSLMSVRQRIRNSIQRANEPKINGLISERKLLLDKIGVYKKYLATVPKNGISGTEAVTRKIDKMRTSSTSDHYAVADMVTVSAWPCIVDFIQPEINAMSKQVSKLEDALSKENHTMTVIIDDSDEALLQQLQIL